MQTEKTTASAADRMQQRRAEALGKVESLCWQEADADSIADAALKGGLSADEVTKIEGRVAEAQTLLEAVKTADLPRHREAVAATTAALQSAEATLAGAQSAHDTAAAESWDAERALEQATSTLRACALAVQGGRIPSDKAPTSVLLVVEYDRIIGHVGKLQSEHAAVGIQLRRIGAEISALEAEASRIENDRGSGQTIRVGAAGLVDGAENVRGQLRILQANLATLTARRDAIEGKLIPEAEAAAKAAKATAGL